MLCGQRRGKIGLERCGYGCAGDVSVMCMASAVEWSVAMAGVLCTHLIIWLL